MADLEYTVTNQGISTSKTSRLVSGTIGVYTVKFTFNNVWDGLEKWATFDPIPGTPYKQPLDANGECTIPGEVMGGVYLRIGVFGLAEGQAYPTIWASKLPLEEGCFVNVPPSDWPEPSPLLEDVVKVSEQTFTDAQKAQARTNIGAAGSADMATALEGKVDKPVGATEGNVAVIGSNHNIVDGGFKATEAFPVGSASGSIATFSDGADGVPIKSMTVQIVPIQAGSDGPSPSNVRAISGWTAMKIPKTPANLLCKDAITEGYYIDNTNGALVTYASWYASDWIKVTAGKRYRARVAGSGTYDNVTNGNCYFAFYDSNRVYLSGGTTAQMNAPANAVWLRMSTPKTMLSTIIVVELSYASIYTVLADYTEGNTYTIEFPTEAGTVYGGQLQVAEDGSGTLTVDLAKHVYNDIVLTSAAAVSAGLRVDFACPADDVNSGKWSLSYFPLFDRLVNNRGLILNGLSKGYSRNSYTTIVAASNIDEAKAILDGMEMVYKITTPVTYDLTVSQVSTLLGLNNIWADTGDIAVEYHADPTLFVEQKTTAIKKTIAYVQNDFTAVQQYLVNDLVYVGDTLYIVTSAIAQGATMTPNTNCAETTLNAVIKSLR